MQLCHCSPLLQYCVAGSWRAYSRGVERVGGIMHESNLVSSRTHFIPNTQTSRFKNLSILDYMDQTDTAQIVSLHNTDRFGRHVSHLKQRTLHSRCTFHQFRPFRGIEPMTLSLSAAFISVSATDQNEHQMCDSAYMFWGEFVEKT